MFKVLRNGLPRYIFFTHAPTSNVKPPGTRLLEAPFEVKPAWSPLQGEAPLKPPSSPLEEAIHCVAFWTLVTSQLCNSSGSNNNQLQPTATYNNQQHLKPPWGIREAPFQRWRLQAPFEPPSSPLQAPSKPPGAWRGLQGGFKGAWRGLEAFQRWRGLRGAWRGLEGGFKGASRGLEGGFTFGRLQGVLKGASRGLEGAKVKPPSSPLQAPFKPPWSPLEALLKPPWSLPKVKPPSTFRPSSPPPPRPQTLQAKGVPRNQPQLATPRARMSTVQINKLNQRRRWQKSVGSKSVQGEDRKEQVANRELCRWQRNQKVVNRGEPVARDP